MGIKKPNVFFVIFIILWAIMIIGAIKEWKNDQHDGIYEEMTEEMIEHFTGINIDLTQDSPETGYLP